MNIPYHEWLDRAQALAVGASRRVQHGNEGRANMVIYNNVDGWSAWCHSCNAGGLKLKQHVRVGEQPEPAEPRGLFPEDYAALAELPERTVHRIATFLASKGLDLATHTQDTRLGYSPKQDRMILSCYGQGGGQFWMGRALGAAQPKWVLYRFEGGHFAAFAATTPTDTSPGTRATEMRREPSCIVLVEDYLSALKIAHAAPYALSVAVLGTRVSDSLVHMLINARSPVKIMFDGDPAGDKGSAAAARRLRGLGVQVSEIIVPQGKDPKDLSTAELRDLLPPYHPEHLESS